MEVSVIYIKSVFNFLLVIFDRRFMSCFRDFIIDGHEVCDQFENHA